MLMASREDELQQDEQGYWDVATGRVTRVSRGSWVRVEDASHSAKQVMANSSVERAL